jgi:hypothetical protein
MNFIISAGTRAVLRCARTLTAASFAVKSLWAKAPFPGGLQRHDLSRALQSSALSERWPAPKHPAEYAFFKCGEAGAPAGSWSRDAYYFVQRDAASFDQDDTVRQSYRLGNIVRYKHCSEAATSPDLLDQLLHLDACKRVERAERFVEEQQIWIMDKSAS